MEVVDKGISIQSVCPGPIETPFLRSLFTEKLSNTFDGKQTSVDSRMKVDRCAQLIMVTMVNNLKEVWISPQPILLFVYMSQYFPNLAKW